MKEGNQDAEKGACEKPGWLQSRAEANYGPWLNLAHCLVSFLLEPTNYEWLWRFQMAEEK